MVKWGAGAIPTTNILLLAHLFRIAHLQVIKLKRTFIFHNMNSFVHGMWCRFGVLRSLALPPCYPILSIFRFRLHTEDATTAAPVPHTSHDLKRNIFQPNDDSPKKKTQQHIVLQQKSIMPCLPPAVRINYIAITLFDKTDFSILLLFAVPGWAKGRMV